MTDIILRLLISGAFVILIAWITPGVEIRDFGSALVVAAVLAILNYFVRPIMVILTLPITLITFGLFIWVINALMVYLTSSIVSGFRVDGFRYALLYSLFLSILNYFFGQHGMLTVF